MTLFDDEELGNFIKDSSEEAFSGIVARYESMVYGVCLRRLSRTDLAEDGFQAVFLSLHQKASGFNYDVKLGPWLYKTANYVCLQILREEKRRKQREKMAEKKKNQNLENKSTWEDYQPLIDEALQAIPEKNKDVIVLHYLNGKTFRDTAAMVGCTEDTAKKRAASGLEKVRRFLKGKGVRIATPALAGGLTANMLKAAPMNLSQVVSTGIFAKGAAAATGAGSGMALANSSIILKGVSQMAFYAKMKSLLFIAAPVLLVGASIVIYVSHITGNDNPKSSNKAPWYAAFRSNKARMMTDTNTMRQLGSLILLYTQDNNGDLPENLMDLVPYVQDKNFKVSNDTLHFFKSEFSPTLPNPKDIENNQADFQYYGKGKLTAVKNPAKKIIMISKPGVIPGRGIIALYYDLRVERYNDWDKIQPFLKAHKINISPELEKRTVIND